MVSLRACALHVILSSFLSAHVLFSSRAQVRVTKGEGTPAAQEIGYLTEGNFFGEVRDHLFVCWLCALH